MDTNFNETFLDKNSASYNYYIGIPNMETNNVSDIENSIKMYKKLNLDYLSINIFNFYLHSFISRDMNRDLIELINKFISGLSRKYKITFIFSYSISANPIAYFDCWNSQFIYKGDVKSIKQLSEYLLTDRSSFITVKKPHRGILSLLQTKILQKKLCSVEICNLNSDCNITDFESIYYNLLDKGWVIGAISSYNSLNSKGWYTGIISRHCYSEIILDSIRNKSTYSTSVPDLKLYFSINFTPMGKTLELDNHPSILSFYIFTESEHKIISSIEIISNQQKIIKRISMIYLNRIHYIFKYRMTENNTWFVIRVIGKDGVLAISSPIFINRKSID